MDRAPAGECTEHLAVSPWECCGRRLAGGCSSSSPDALSWTGPARAGTVLWQFRTRSFCLVTPDGLSFASTHRGERELRIVGLAAAGALLGWSAGPPGCREAGGVAVATHILAPYPLPGLLREWRSFLEQAEEASAF